MENRAFVTEQGYGRCLPIPTDVGDGVVYRGKPGSELDSLVSFVWSKTEVGDYILVRWNASRIRMDRAVVVMGEFLDRDKPQDFIRIHERGTCLSSFAAFPLELLEVEGITGGFLIE